MSRRPLFTALMTAILVAACSSTAATPTPTAIPTPTPTAVPTPTIAPTPTQPATPTPLATPTPFPTGIPGALAVVRAYEDALIAGNYAGAWALLGAGAQAGWGSLSAYTSERTAFMKSAGTVYTATANPSGTMSLTDWLAGTPFAGSIDTAHAVLVEVDWAALSGNNAGMEMWVANPVPGGWQLYEVR